MNAIDVSLFLSSEHRKHLDPSERSLLPAPPRASALSKDNEKELIALLYRGANMHEFATQRFERLLWDWKEHPSERATMIVRHVAIDALSAAALPVLLIIESLLQRREVAAAAALLFRTPTRSDLVRRLHVMGAHPASFQRQHHDTSASASASASAAVLPEEADDAEDSKSSVSTNDSSLGISYSSLPHSAIAALCRVSAQSSPWFNMLSEQGADSILSTLRTIVLFSEDWTAIDALTSVWSSDALRPRLCDLLLDAFARIHFGVALQLFQHLFQGAQAHNEDVVALAWLSLVLYRQQSTDGVVACPNWLQRTDLAMQLVQDAQVAVRDLAAPSDDEKPTEVMLSYRPRIARTRREHNLLSEVIDIEAMTADARDAYETLDFVRDFQHVAAVKCKRRSASFVHNLSLFAMQGRDNLINKRRIFLVKSAARVDAAWSRAQRQDEDQTTAPAPAPQTQAHGDTVPDAVRAVVREHVRVWSKLAESLQRADQQSRMLVSVSVQHQPLPRTKHAPMFVRVIDAAEPTRVAEPEQKRQEREHAEEEEEEADEEEEDRDPFGLTLLARRDPAQSRQSVHVSRMLHFVTATDLMTTASVLLTMMAHRNARRVANLLGAENARVLRFTDHSIPGAPSCCDIRVPIVRACERTFSVSSVAQTLRVIDDTGATVPFAPITFDTLLSTCLVRYFIGVSDTMVPILAGRQHQNYFAFVPFKWTDLHARTYEGDCENTLFLEERHDVLTGVVRDSDLVATLHDSDALGAPALVESSSKRTLSPAQATMLLTLLHHPEDEEEEADVHKRRTRRAVDASDANASLRERRTRQHVGELVDAVLQDLQNLAATLQDSLTRGYGIPTFVACAVARELDLRLVNLRSRIETASKETRPHLFLSALS